MKKKIIALIPARYESKSVKRKNFKKLNGKPLIEYTISKALKSTLIDKVIISTDNYNYLKILKRNKNKKLILHNRSKVISGDNTKMISVINDVLKKLGKLKYNFDYLVLLQPTSPFKRSQDIEKSIKKIIKLNADTLISVYKVDDNHPARMYVSKGDYLKNFLPRFADVNRQKLPTVYHRNGAIYIFNKKILLKKILYGKKIIFHEMPYINSINIDNKIDWITCEKILKDKLLNL